MLPLPPSSWHFSEAAGPCCEEVPLCRQLALQGHRTQTHGGSAGCQAERTETAHCQQTTHCCQFHSQADCKPVKRQGDMWGSYVLLCISVNETVARKQSKGCKFQPLIEIHCYCICCFLAIKTKTSPLLSSNTLMNLVRMSLFLSLKQLIL